MSGEASIGPGSRARPVADAPIEGLLARSDDLAKRWVLAVAAARGLAEIATLPLAQIVHVAPSLCARALQAIRSDDALAWAQAPGLSAVAGGEGPMRLGWDGDPREVVAAVEALRMVLWDALVNATSAQGLGAQPDRLLRDLADRLAYVCGVVLAESLPGEASSRPFERPLGAEAAAGPRTPPWSAPLFHDAPSVQRGERVEPARARGARQGETASGAESSPPPLASASSPREHAARGEGSPARGATGSRAAIVDEFVPAPDRARAGARAPGRGPEAAGAMEREHLRTSAAEGRALPWDIPLTRERRAPESRKGFDSRPAPVPRPPAAEGSEISVLRRRPPRERE